MDREDDLLKAILPSREEIARRVAERRREDQEARVEEDNEDRTEYERIRSRPIPPKQVLPHHWATLPMTVREFCAIGGYELSTGLRKRIGIRASQLFLEMLRGRRSPKRTVYFATSSISKYGDIKRKRHRTKVGVYTFGILRQALDDVMNGVLDEAAHAEQPKRRRGRPRKVTVSQPPS